MPLCYAARAPEFWARAPETRATASPQGHKRDERQRGAQTHGSSASDVRPCIRIRAASLGRPRGGRWKLCQIGTRNSTIRQPSATTSAIASTAIAASRTHAGIFDSHVSRSDARAPGPRRALSQPREPRRPGLALQKRGFGCTRSNLWLRPASQFIKARSLCRSRHAMKAAIIAIPVPKAANNETTIAMIATKVSVIEVHRSCHMQTAASIRPRPLRLI